MSTSPAKNNKSTMMVIGVLGTVLVVGAVVFIYLGIQLLGHRSDEPQVADAPSAQGTLGPAAATATKAPTLTPTAARTPVVIVAATAIPYTPGPMPPLEDTPEASGTGGSQAEVPSEADTTTATPRVAKTSSPIASGGTDDGELPQTGLGLGVPIVGLLLAGVASAARWLRKQR